jgi:transposase
VLDKTQLSHPVRVDPTREAVLAVGRILRPDDEVEIEATVNTAMIAHLLSPFVHKVAIANPRQVRAIAHAKIKTDKIDAAHSVLNPVIRQSPPQAASSEKTVAATLMAPTTRMRAIGREKGCASSP